MKLIRLHTKLLFLAAIISILFISSCSTKKNTWTRRAYHNVTCHYNVFWNGKNSLYEGATTLEQSVNNNYNDILRVYDYGTLQEAQSLNSQMDRSIKKASIGIQRHSMYFGGKEYVKWVKVSYLMMGKAHFYKQDYTSARRVFDYVSKEYVNSPIQYEGYLWLAKTFIETERFEKAEAAINYLQSKRDNEKFSHTVEQELPFVIADFYIAQENYDAAYSFLERALEIGNDRDLITRVNFILGQINQMDGDFETASVYYNKVISRNPEYRMAFEARMNLAQCYDDGVGDSRNINKLLHKMVKDSKNRDFLDQIYYALADVALKDNNEMLGIEYLAKSVSSSTTNNFQRTESSLKLADIYFAKNKYQLAEAYYDTAVSFLPEEYPDYESIKNKATVLTEMVRLSSTISEQDSLLYLSTLDTNALYSIIDRLIAQKQAEKQREEQYGDEGGIEFIDVGQQSRNPNLQTGKWYFYNTAAMSYGYSEFIKKWGTRKLEDNWRLSDKRLVMQAFEDELTDEDNLDLNDSIAADPESNPENRDFYLIDIPFTDEQKQLANEQIMTSYKQLGFLYMEDLRDTTNALETYQTLLEKYPDNPYKLEAWYALYKIFSESGEKDKSNYYRGLIISNFPDSDYAKVISDPDYFNKLNEGKNRRWHLMKKHIKLLQENNISGLFLMPTAA